MSTREIPLTPTLSGEDVCEYSAEVPRDLVYFEGHFENKAVLPAVAQLESMILIGVRRSWPSLGPLARVRRLKFRRLIFPGECLTLRLERSKDDVVAFTLRREDATCASGILDFKAHGV